MSAQLIVCVLGATGAQGSSVCEALLKDGQYSVRGVSRNPDSKKSKALTERGVEMVRGDTADKASLVLAFRHCFAVFGVTNYWDPSVGTKEFEHGKNIVDAAKEALVDHFVYSSLPNCHKVSGGKLEVPHFSLKADVEEYARNAGLLSCAFLQAGCYMQNFLTFWPPKVETDGTVNFVMALKQSCALSLFDVADTGAAFVSLLHNWKHWAGQSIPLCGSNMTPAEIVSTFQRVTGVPAKYTELPEAELAVKDAELSDMFEWFNDFSYFGPFEKFEIGHECKLARLTTFEEWLRKSGWNGKPLTSSAF